MTAMTMTADVAWGSIVGGRERQEDYCAAMSWPNGFRLLVLGDGMGGEVGGAEASQTAVERFRDSFVDDEESGTRARLLNALQDANHAIRDAVRAEPELGGMGTTLLGLAFDSGAVHWLSVGDSPLWLYRGGELKRLNQNHSVGGELDAKAAANVISWAEAAAAEDRHQLLEAVAGWEIELVDAPEEPFAVVPGDIIVLASDGVETCAPGELEEIMAAVGKDRDADALTAQILQRVKAHDAPRQDNATVMVMAVRSEAGESDTVRAEKPAVIPA